MNAVRQIHKVQNGSVTIQLPPDFDVDEVEVIVLPAGAEATSANGSATPPNGEFIDELNDEGDDKLGGGLVSDAEYWEAVAGILATDTSHFSEEKKKAFIRTREILLCGRKPGEPPPVDPFAGLVYVADDFDAPLPKEIEDLFYGSESDEYGISLASNQ